MSQSVGDEHWSIDAATVRGKKVETVCQHFPDGWVAVYYMLAQDGDPVVAAVAILAGEPDDFPDCLSAAPPDGFGTRLLQRLNRRLNPAMAQQLMREQLRFGEGPRPVEPGQPHPHAHLLADHGYGESDLRGRHRAGRPRLPDRFLAHVAARYVEATEGGSPRPVKDVADAMGYTPARVRDFLTAARLGELLTRPDGPGRAGGRLTEKGKRALAEGADLDREIDRELGSADLALRSVRRGCVTTQGGLTQDVFERDRLAGSVLPRNVVPSHKRDASGRGAP